MSYKCPMCGSWQGCFTPKRQPLHLLQRQVLEREELEELQHLLENVNRAGPFVGKAEQRLQAAARKVLPGLLDRLEKADQVITAAKDLLAKVDNMGKSTETKAWSEQETLRIKLTDYERTGALK